jgi:hypothetical protein
MRALSAPELLNVWEQGLAQPPIQRALTLLAAACSETPAVLANLSVGERDGRLLTLREWAFGSQLVSLANCPNCGERLEWTFNAADLRAARLGDSGETLAVKIDRYHVNFRLPNSLDLAAVAGFSDVESARGALLERCISNAECDGQQISAEALPPQITETVVEQMSQADTQADIELDLTCPGCDHRWQALFDIESFFWSEINAWAQRILTEIHTLATAYGWREMDILNMSPSRRQVYLSFIGA